ncbi:hypothetical protein [Rhizobium leguminosarum]|uniref:Uncharacterized protein n=1 Tax=Rhizobium leguminosarum TaxID=384 RepID=A0A7X0A075_RHILE|nr:hypothetical protein [Rhizobium leguminosarum]MBB5666593.1 hypothetical protein [Rhizobium leguminosarum]MBB6225353.1 hypothetical protein [Rhizobium leguminosarum]
MIPTISGGNTGRTQADIDDKRKQLAYAMLEQGMDASPVQSPWQGAARLAQALMGGLAIRQQDQERQVGTTKGPTAPTGAPATPPAKSPGFLSSWFGGQRSE